MPDRLVAGARVLKQYRGHSGIGVWRVERADTRSQPLRLRVRHAQRGSGEELMDLSTLLATVAPCFEKANGGHMIDQRSHPRLVEGMVRAYLVEDRVEGFGQQSINALYPGVPGEPAPQPGPRLYHAADLPQFQDLKKRLENERVAMLCTQVGFSPIQLPLLWDCDFILGERFAAAEECCVLCDINVSSVAPLPESATQPLVSAGQRRL